MRYGGCTMVQPYSRAPYSRGVVKQVAAPKRLTINGAVMSGCSGLQPYNPGYSPTLVGIYLIQ